jgi:glyoxylase-like metal-dependent hydrolase (beta-lactamase superfamily II)
MLKIESFVVNDFQENTYVIWDSTGECIIIDPGSLHKAERDTIVGFITQNSLKPVKVLNTHCHIDHILGNNYFTGHYNIPLCLHQGELFTYKDAGKWSAMLGIPECVPPDNLVFVSQKDAIRFGRSSLNIAFTPGHSIASITFYNLEEKFAISGDVLFYESIGRTDLPGGNYETLIHSIMNELMIWEDDVRVFSGHGPQTTIGHERLYNPFLK